MLYKVHHVSVIETDLGLWSLMRNRIASAALAGAASLAAVTVAPTVAAAATPGPVITRVSVNDLAVALTGHQQFALRISASDAQGIKSIHALIWPLAANGVRPTPALVAQSNLVTPRSRTSTSETVGFDFSDDFAKGYDADYEAGEFGIAVLVTANDGTTTYVPKAATYFIRFADALSAKANTKQVRKSAMVTVKGQLNRADWDLRKWRANGGQWVKLQYRKAGSNTWVTEGWAKTTASGALAVSARDHASGWWRFSYAGSLTCAPATSTQYWITAG
ncbi:hypothetical protein ABH931_000479 [Streptacidiphilus sp. MAP12-33]|uniref:hypothetical protein n=1 Tax=Streptacidiphilus sp. MAP12-33 TaxID=3156266 RepID=UPI0035127045